LASDFFLEQNNMKTENAIVAMYSSHEDAEKAINDLKTSGYNIKHLSIVGKDYHSEENVVGYYNLGDRVMQWGANGAFWGAIWGLLFGSAFLVIPGVGPLVVAGRFAATLISVLEGAITFGGFSALGAALISLGIPKNSVLEYETDIKAGKFMLLAHGTAQEVANAKSILGIEDEVVIS
jgi:uncharacterized membrane protein